MHTFVKPETTFFCSFFFFLSFFPLMKLMINMKNNNGTRAPSIQLFFFVFSVSSFVSSILLSHRFCVGISVFGSFFFSNWNWASRFDWGKSIVKQLDLWKFLRSIVVYFLCGRRRGKLKKRRIKLCASQRLIFTLPGFAWFAIIWIFFFHFRGRLIRFANK